MTRIHFEEVLYLASSYIENLPKKLDEKLRGYIKMLHIIIAPEIVHDSPALSW
jgi:hypothetical protein